MDLSGNNLEISGILRLLEACPKLQDRDPNIQQGDGRRVKIFGRFLGKGIEVILERNQQTFEDGQVFYSNILGFGVNFKVNTSQDSRFFGHEFPVKQRNVAPSGFAVLPGNTTFWKDFL